MTATSLRVSLGRCHLSETVFCYSKGRVRHDQRSSLQGGGDKLEDICPSTHNMDIPIVKRKEYQLLSINDDEFLSLMDLETCETKDDLRVPDNELGTQIKQAFEKDENALLISVVAACGEEMVMGWKNMPNKD
uniref:Translation elongation factor IF5A C-terminal domain-containing protein n=1 Tax=Ditylenchus dipsaci TaxID=166011 RepID=A0A915DES5_9BILA